jgi:membrane associated rhomboid family serine protease
MSSLPAPASSEQEQFRLTPAVQGIIAINLVVMFLQLTAVRYSYTSEWLGFDATRVPSQWWSVATYSLVHTGIGHLLANLYCLYLFGPRVERSWSANGVRGRGAKRFAWFYLLCALGGVAFDMLFMRQGVLTGSSAAVFGVMTAYVMQWPNDEVYFLFVLPMRAKTLAVGLIAFNVLVGFTATGAGGSINVAYFAHLGGIVASYVYVRMAASTGMEQVRQRVANVPDADEPPRAIPRNLPRRERGDEVDDIVAKSKALAAKRAVAVSPSSRRREARADELNRVLDKISQQGIESLTNDERKLLEEMSKRLRGN